MNGHAPRGAEHNVIEAREFDEYAQEMVRQDLATMIIAQALPEVFPEPIWTTEWWSLGRINDRDMSVLQCKFIKVALALHQNHFLL